MALTIYVFNGSLTALLDLQSDRTYGWRRCPCKTILSVNVIRIQWGNFYSYFFILKDGVLEVDRDHLIRHINGTVVLEFTSQIADNIVHNNIPSRSGSCCTKLAVSVKDFQDMLVGSR